ncbi:MAG: tetratricopeptide repeat protein, partial [Myxococcota bacterium]
GFIYYQIVVSSSRTDFIMDLKSTPSLGTIPPINNSSSKNVEKKEDSQTKNEATGSKGSKIPIKAKKSALEHYKKGNQYFMESKYEQARDEYAMAIAADPGFGLAYRGLGTTYAKLGQPDLAVKNYEKYIEVMPNASDAEQVKNIIKQYYGK